MKQWKHPNKQPTKPTETFRKYLNQNGGTVLDRSTRYKFIVVVRGRGPCQCVGWIHGHTDPVWIVEIFVQVNNRRLLDVGVDDELQLEKRRAGIESHRDGST